MAPGGVCAAANDDVNSTADRMAVFIGSRPFRRRLSGDDSDPIAAVMPGDPRHAIVRSLDNGAVDTRARVS